jgi:hypothetical protein
MTHYTSPIRNRCVLRASVEQRRCVAAWLVNLSSTTALSAQLARSIGMNDGQPPRMKTPVDHGGDGVHLR